MNLHSFAPTMPETEILKNLAIQIDDLRIDYLQNKIIGVTNFNGKEYTILNNNTLIRYCFIGGLQVVTFKDNILPKDMVIDYLEV